MGETTDQIESHIRETRQDLNANLNELEHKVRSATDWRQQYQKSPGTFLAVAVGSGVLLALMTRGRRPPAPTMIVAPAALRHEPAPRPPKPPSEIDHSVSAIKSALIGVVTSQAQGLLSKLVPGFQQQLADKAQYTPRPPDNVRAAASDGYRRSNGISEEKNGVAEQHNGGDYATHQ